MAALRWLIVRVLITLALLTVTSMLVWAAVHALAGDPVTAVLGGAASPEQVERLRQQLGLELPVHEQYLTWLFRVMRGDLGTSLVTGADLMPVVLGRLHASAAVAAWAALAVLLLFVPIGVVAGLRPDSPSGRLLNGTAVAIAAVPEFVLGAALVGLLAVRLHWLPALSTLRSGDNPWLEPRLVALPALITALAVGGWCVRLVRGVVAAAAYGPVAEAARTAGVPEGEVVRRYVLPQAIAPVAQTLGWLTAGMVSTAVIGEQLVGYSGIGELLVTSARYRDLPAVAAVALVLAVVVACALLVSDVVAGMLDPRLRPWRR